MNIDVMIKELEDLKRQGTDRVFVKGPFRNYTTCPVTTIKRDKDSDAVIA